MRNVELNEVAYQVPERWEECTPEQLQTLLPLRLINLEALKPAQRIRLKWKAVLTLMDPDPELVIGLEPDDRRRLAYLSNWIWKQDKIEKQPFAWFDFVGVRYYLPDPGFANTSAIEIALANMAYLAFTRKEKPNTSAVFQIIATLCRPERKDLEAFKASPDWNGDRREEYNTILANERAEAFEKGQLPAGVVMGVLHYFEHLNRGFLKQYKDVYSGDDENEEPLYKNGEGLVTMLMEVAKTGTFGDFDKVCKQNGHTVWIFLRDSNLKVKRANQRAERADE